MFVHTQDFSVTEKSPDFLCTWFTTDIYTWSLVTFTCSACHRSFSTSFNLHFGFFPSQILTCLWHHVHFQLHMGFTLTWIWVCDSFIGFRITSLISIFIISISLHFLSHLSDFYRSEIILQRYIWAERVLLLNTELLKRTVSQLTCNPLDDLDSFFLPTAQKSHKKKNNKYSGFADH